MSNKRCLITGITGMVGSHLADFLFEYTDFDIYGLYRWNDDLSNIRHLIPKINCKNRICLINGDINDVVSLMHALDLSQPDYVFHLAAQSYPKTSFESPVETMVTNVLGTTNLLESIKKSDLFPVVHVCASSEVFGRVGQESIPISEDVPFHPASPYAISKVGTDLLGRFYGEAYGMHVMTTRMFTHTGPRRGDVFAESSFAKQIAMIENNLMEPVVRVGNLKSMRTWSDVRDAVRAYYMLVTINPIPGEYYNIGGVHSCTVGDMLDTLLSMSNVKGIQVEVDPSRIRPIDADNQIPDCSKFKAHTGWKPEIPFEKTMNDLLQYWREKVSKNSTELVR